MATFDPPFLEDQLGKKELFQEFPASVLKLGMAKRRKPLLSE